VPRKGTENVSSVKLTDEEKAAVDWIADAFGITKHAALQRCMRAGISAVRQEAADWLEFKATRAAEREGKPSTRRKTTR
jgi:predicted transcriptional regulator